MTRRHHTKSRGGCISCKERRVKCDEQKPYCSKCVIRKLPCKYGLKAPLVWMNKDYPPGSSPDRDGPLEINPKNNGRSLSDASEFLGKSSKIPHDKEDELLCSGLDCKGPELMINWFTSTVYTVNPDNEEALRTCQTVILKEALSHKFLMNGLLALSALHLADQRSGNDGRRYLRIAIRRHSEGLAMFRSELQNITASNHSAIIAFSSVTIMFSFAMSRPLQENSSSLLHDLAQIFQLAKGWYEIVRVTNLDLESQMKVDLPDKEGFDLPGQARRGLLDLYELNSKSAEHNKQHDAETYAGVIDSLGCVYGKLFSGSTNPHIVLEWANMLPGRFCRLLEEQDMLGIIIIGHYCVVLEGYKHLWWLNGWSSSLLKEIWRKVDPVHRCWLNWPMEMLGLSASDM